MCGHEMTAHRNPISVFRSLSLSVPRLESKGRGMRDAERAQRGDAIGLVHAFDGYDLSNHETWRATQTDHGKITQPEKMEPLPGGRFISHDHHDQMGYSKIPGFWQYRTSR